MMNPYLLWPYKAYEIFISFHLRHVFLPLSRNWNQLIWNDWIDGKVHESENKNRFKITRKSRQQQRFRGAKKNCLFDFYIKNALYALKLVWAVSIALCSRPKWWFSIFLVIVVALMYEIWWRRRGDQENRVKKRRFAFEHENPILDVQSSRNIVPTALPKAI